MTTSKDSGLGVPGAPSAEAERIDALYRAKAHAEITEALDAGSAVAWSGDVLADVLLVKGEPGADDVRAGSALAGADGDAINKALDALEASPARFAICSRALDGEGGDRARTLRLVAEAVDPRVIVALDADAATDVAAAFAIEVPAFGVPVTVGGRTVLAIEDFAGSLGEEALKRAAWAQLRALKVPRG